MKLKYHTREEIYAMDVDPLWYKSDDVDGVLALKDVELEHLNDVICSLNERIAEYEGSDLR